MRLLAPVSRPGAEVRWVIVHDTPDGTYLFELRTERDGSSTGDDWFASLDDATEHAQEAHGIGAGDWIDIGEPPPGCQQDWVSPVRRVAGGGLERRVGGAWVGVGEAPTVAEVLAGR